MRPPLPAGWVINAAGVEISKNFEFKSYAEGLRFLNQVAAIAEAEAHHPDMTLGYKKLRVAFSTHDTNGLSDKDFICASKVELLMV